MDFEEKPGPGAAGSGQLSERTQSILTACNGAEPPLQKRWRTMQARAALEGFRADLIDGDDGLPRLVVSRWGHARTLATLADADAWIARIAPGHAEGAAP